MQNLAKWMGYEEGVNYTGKKAYFRPVRGDELELICNVKDYDPRVHPDLFVKILGRAVRDGAEITVHRKSQKNSAHFNVEAVVEIGHQIHRSIGIDPPRAITNALVRYVDNLEFNR